MRDERPVGAAYGHRHRAALQPCEGEMMNGLLRPAFAGVDVTLRVPVRS